MLKQKYLLISLFAIILLILSGCTPAKQLMKKAPADAHFSDNPTIFLHGFGGNASSMQPLINAIERAKLGTAVETIHVRANDTLATTGTLTAKANNPLINIVFDDSTNGNPAHNARILRVIIEKLHHQYHFKKFNVVAHSMGNSTLAEYLLNNSNNSNLPTLNKYVAIASISNSFIGGSGSTNASRSPLLADGQPTIKSTIFNHFSKLHTTFPKAAHVLNIFGNLNDGSESDGRVPINSAQALKYLTSRSASYQQQEFTGSNAQHSKLKRNPQVEKTVMHFLFED
ncbi:alpha/beta hydrolase [Periweissella fabalis]|uniref:Alpha/beta hydrolase n=1 Tax=Periweissella fabalis TaxID=1070421 RepID=A0A7X6N179_9LACO|nr:alpha/beta hydrolase [Periweissella fabalis]MCM0599631.1 alpha/beta hydrolase [Periweissella fabalis]NKZ23936.1 alpha/beta hydrolase [Periweissella fabalis]